MKRELLLQPRVRPTALVNRNVRRFVGPLGLVFSIAGCTPSGGAVDGVGAKTAWDANEAKAEAENARIESNFLEFRDLDAFFEALQSLKGKDQTALESWEASRNFVSMNRIYERIIEETEQNRADGQDGDEGEDASRELSYSVRYAGMLRPGRLGLDMNVTVDEYAKLVNKDGLVRIGDFIYQFTRNKVKAIGGQGGSRVSVLKQAQTTNEGLAVWVTPVRILKGGANADPRLALLGGADAATAKPAAGSFSRSCESVAGRSRLIAYEEFIEWTDPADPKRIVTNYGLTVRSLKREGAWLNHRTGSMKAEGWYEGSDPLGKKSYRVDTAGGATVSTLRYPFLENHQVFDPAARPVVYSSTHHVFGESNTACHID